MFPCLGFRIAVAREAQEVAMEQELLESLPLLYKNQPEQVTMALECKGKGGQPCQGPANITVTVRQMISRHIFVSFYVFSSYSYLLLYYLFVCCVLLPHSASVSRDRRQCRLK